MFETPSHAKHNLSKFFKIPACVYIANADKCQLMTNEESADYAPLYELRHISAIHPVLLRQPR